VRRGRSYDLNAVVDLYAGCGLVPSERGFRNELERKLLADPDLFLVAAETDAGRIIGALSAGFDGRTVVVSRLATHPERRRQGVAAALVNQMEGVLARVGGAGASLVVMDDTVDSRSFWAGIGYDHSGRVPVYRRAAE
jgi:ribosomal protein S18 acetylase RimI-like enzyme